jgi:hypothetical protein
MFACYGKSMPSMRYSSQKHQAGPMIRPELIFVVKAFNFISDGRHEYHSEFVSIHGI